MAGKWSSVLALVAFLASCAPLLQGCGGGASMTCSYETGTGDQKISYKLTVTCDGDSKYKVHQELTQGGKTSSTDTEQNMASGKCDQASIDDLKKQLCPNNDEELEVIMKTQLVV